MESAFDPVWHLARQGFTCVQDGITVYVRASDNLDAAETDTRAALVAALTPDARRAVTDPEDWTIHLLTHARRVLLARAVRAARTLSLLNPEEIAQIPREAEDLDRLIEADVRPAPRQPTVDPEIEHRLKLGLEQVAALKPHLSRKLADLLEERFVNGRTRAECAEVFDCGTAAIATRESKIRRRLASRLRARRDPGLARARAATLDALLSGRGPALAPPRITRERICRSVLTRTFRSDPRPYRERLAWGAGTAAVAGLGWVAVLCGWLPGPDDDPTPPPRVQAICPQGCQAGQPVHIAVRAPAFGRTVGVGLVDPRGEVVMLLHSTSGGSVRLPFGARTKLVAARRAELPAGPVDLSHATVVAVFSNRRIDKPTLEQAVSLEAIPDRVTTTTAALIQDKPR